jgi:hypothetical protein
MKPMKQPYAKPTLLRRGSLSPITASPVSVT